MQDAVKKPKAKVIGKDGNVFNIIAICSKALKDVNREEDAKKMVSRVYASKSYYEALAIMQEYVDMV